MPIVRTFATVMAGTSRMNFRIYALYSMIGGIVWAAGVTCAGLRLGNVAVIKNNIELIAVLIVLVSVVPIAVELLRGRRRTRNTPVPSSAAADGPEGAERAA